MKKGVITFLLLTIVLAQLIIIISAADDDLSVSDTSDENSEEAQVDLAYDCLKDKIDESEDDESDSCESLSVQERIFMVLALHKCKSEFLDDSSDEACWPTRNCNVKTTAQAIMALEELNRDTEDAEEWLLDRETSPQDLDWYLQIESNRATTCTIEYSGGRYNLDIGDNKKLSSTELGPCLDIDSLSDDYWLKITSTVDCNQEEFEVKCDEGFSTNLLFMKQGSPVVHVLEKTTYAVADKAIVEVINFSCLTDGSTTDGICNYEGTLWAALALDYVGNTEQVSKYLVYLTALAEDNDEYLPEAFLYFLKSSAEYKTELLSKQYSEGYWKEGDDNIYDTALALYPFQPDSLAEKSEAQDWLLRIQGRDGCWRSTIDTAFVLYSVWPKYLSDSDSGDSGNGSSSSSSGGGTTTNLTDCEDSGYYCISSYSCSEVNGTVLSNYDCGYTSRFKCCSKPPLNQTCQSKGGTICTSLEDCIDGTKISASDTLLGQTCCFGGSCEESEDSVLDTCTQASGTCRDSYCKDGEEIEYDYTCGNYNDVCCVESADDDTEEKSYWWIYVIIALIVLVILGILFRDKLQPLWFKLQSKFNKRGPPPRPGMMPGRPGMPLMRGPLPPRPIQRTIVPPSQRPSTPHTSTPPTQSRPMPPRGLPLSRQPQRKSEVDDVLKKLKEMGK